MEIQTYIEADRDEIIALVLHCQNDGTRPLVSIDDQPELLHIQEKYLDNGGNFWVAKEQGKVAGSIGLMMCGNGLVDFAKKNGVKRIILDTPKNTDRAHKFYEKAGFEKITKEDLPIDYDYPYEDSDFFSLIIR